MRRTLRVLPLVVLLAIACPALLAEENLLYNGDFEVDSTAAPPPGWVRWGDSSGQTNADYTRDTTNPHSGEGCYRIHHPANTRGYTVSEYHDDYPIETQEGKAYTITFWARADVPTTSLFYWDCYTSIQPFVDATSAGRLPYEVTTEWREYSFTVDEGRDFYADEVRYMLAAFKPVGNEYGLERTLWIDDVVVTERNSTAEPLIDWNDLVYPPLNHRLSPGAELVVNADATDLIGPSAQEAAGASFHSLSGWGRHPYDPAMVYQFTGALAPIEESLRQMRNPMTRFYEVGCEPPGITGSIDKIAELMDIFQMPQDWTVLELEPVAADYTFTPAEWASAASHSVANGYGFRFWEIGNETYTRKATAFPTSDDYVNHLIEVSDAIRAVQPDAQIGISTWPGHPNWGNYTLKAAQGYYDFIVGHYYNHADPYTHSFEEVALKSNYTILDEILRMNALIDAYNPEGGVYQLDTEWGVFGESSSLPEPQKYWRSANIVGTVHDAVRMIYYAREGMMRGAGGWEMLRRISNPTFGFLSRDVPDGAFLRYWLRYYFNRHCGEYAVNISGQAPWYAPSSEPTECGPQTPVLATLSEDGTKMYFVIANGSWSDDVPCTVNLANFQATAATGVLLTQDSMDAEPMIYDPATAISDLPVTMGPETLEFTVPAHSVVFVTAEQPVTEVAGRYVFYNNSAFDGNDPAANSADDAAIATDKDALLPGEVATFSNYTSYSRGINGIMIDLPSLPAAPTEADFTFRVGNDNDPSGWGAAPAPSSITVRSGEGSKGTDRITLIWPDNAIQQQWLEVTVLATANTGLLEPDVFYFGNAIGETGDSPAHARVTPTDQVGCRNHPHTGMDPAGITSPYDFDRDTNVGPTDEILCRTHGTNSMTALRLINLMANQAPTAEAGEDQSITLPTDTVDLDGIAGDDGYPDPPGVLTTTWTKLSGPDGVSFGDSSALDTTATFSAAGVYVLQLEASDGDLTATDTVQVTVYEPSNAFFADDFDDGNLDGWTTLVGSFAAFVFLEEPGCEVHATTRDSRMRAELADTNLSDTVYISFDIRHTYGAPPGGGGSGWKQGRLWLVDDTGSGFGLYFALDQNGSGEFSLLSTSDDGGSESGLGGFAPPGDPDGYDRKQVQLIYDRLGDQVECVYEGVSKGTVSVPSQYSNFTRVVLQLHNHYDDWWGQIDVDEIRIADTPPTD